MPAAPSRSLLPLPIVLGPTGSGKSELAICLASAIGGEIVNCDSLQLYCGFDIGTAKVPLAERRGIPHHLIDVIGPSEIFTAGQYSEAGRACLHEISRRGRIPVVVGGTGFYLRALLDGLFPGPQRDEALRQRLEDRERLRPGSLHRVLTRLDPVAAARIHRNDTNKIIRALEVRLLEGKPISTLFDRGRGPLIGFRAIKLGLAPPRDLLYQQLDARTARLFQHGLVEEVRHLLDSGVPASAKPFESLGYKQALQVLTGQLTRDQAIESTRLETRRYAKRQITWFRKETEVNWLEGFGADDAIQRKALAIIERELDCKGKDGP